MIVLNGAVEDGHRFLYHLDGTEACVVKKMETRNEWYNNFVDVLVETLEEPIELLELEEETVVEEEDDEEAIHDPELLEMYTSAYGHFTEIRYGKPHEKVPAFEYCMDNACNDCMWYEFCTNEESDFLQVIQLLSIQPSESMPLRAYQAGIMKPFGCMLPHDYEYKDMPLMFRTYVAEAMEYCQDGIQACANALMKREQEESGDAVTEGDP